MASGQSFPKKKSELCSLHKEKVVEFYCEDHGEVGCSDCIETKHKSCPAPKTIVELQRKDVIGINKHLKEKMESMKTLRESKDKKLVALEESKREAERQVDKFEEELISSIKESAKDSKSDIDEKFQKLKEDILKDEQSIECVDEQLQRSKRNFEKSAGNNAQRFVCSNQAEKQMKKADRLKIKQNNSNEIHLSLSFSPNQYMKNYVKGLQGIGQVYVRRKKLHEYKIKEQSNINMKISGDSEKCFSSGCCLTQDNKLLVTDFLNKKLKRINLETMIIEDSCELYGHPCGVCCISDKQVAVACWGLDSKLSTTGSIQFVSNDQKMSPTSLIKLLHRCNGIAFNDNKLYVSDEAGSLYVYKMDGTLMNTITCDNTGTKLFSKIRHVAFNENGDKMFVADAVKGLICLDKHGNYLSTVSDGDLKWATGVCVDSNGCVFVTGHESHNVKQYDEDGKKMGIIIKQQDGLYKPAAVCFHQKLNRLFVTMDKSDVVKMYELE